MKGISVQSLNGNWGSECEQDGILCQGSVARVWRGYMPAEGVEGTWGRCLARVWDEDIIGSIQVTLPRARISLTARGGRGGKPWTVSLLKASKSTHTRERTRTARVQTHTHTHKCTHAGRHTQTHTHAHIHTNGVTGVFTTVVCRYECICMRMHVCSSLLNRRKTGLPIYIPAKHGPLPVRMVEGIFLTKSIKI